MRNFVIFRAWLLSFILFIFSVKISVAASISLSTLSSSFSYTDEIPVAVKIAISSADETNYYLRGVFSKEGSSNYCGFTWNGTTFYSGPYTIDDGWKQFLKVSIKNEVWEGEVKVKIDSEDSGCKDSGVYAMRIERFTESGSGIFDTQDPLLLTLTLPTPTLVPTSTPKPSPTLRLTPTKTTGTIKPTEKVISQEVPISTSRTTTISPKVNPHFISYKSSEEAVLGEASESANQSFDEPTPTLFPVKVLGSSTSLWPLIFSTIGGGMLMLCAILAYRIRKNGKLL